MTNKFVLHTRCVDEYTDTHVQRLDQMTSKGREISADSFFRHVDLKQLSAQMGYGYGRQAGQALRLKKDRCVRFFMSHWRGRRCYYMVWSAIEHVFLSRADHRELSQG